MVENQTSIARTAVKEPKETKEIKWVAKESLRSDCLLKKPGLLLLNEEGLEGCNKEGEGCFLSNGDSIHPLPEKQSLHGEVRKSVFKSPSGAVDISKADSKTRHLSKGSPLLNGCEEAPKPIKCLAEELFPPLPEKQFLPGEGRQADRKTPSVPMDFPKSHVKTKYSSKGCSLKKGGGGKGEVFGLSSVASHHLIPGKLKCNVELRTTLGMEPSGAAYIPKANSNSSNRIKAASRAFVTQFFARIVISRKEVPKKEKKKTQTSSVSKYPQNQ